MKLNQSVQYGIACLFELSKTPGDYLDAQEIAARQNIPLAYAHKVLQHLGRTGLVFSLKGMGYKLARPLSQITALEVFNALTKEPDVSLSRFDVGAQLEQRINQALRNLRLSELA